jgi:hypothetical protein
MMCRCHPEVHPRQTTFSNAIGRPHLEANCAHILLEIIVYVDGNVPKFEGVCGDTIKFRLILVLDGLSESADELISTEKTCLASSPWTTQLSSRIGLGRGTGWITDREGLTTITHIRRLYINV